jgi:hypothetical protein
VSDATRGRKDGLLDVSALLLLSIFASPFLCVLTHFLHLIPCLVGCQVCPKSCHGGGKEEAKSKHGKKTPSSTLDCGEA